MVNPRRNDGFTMAELMISIVVSVIVLGAILTFFLTGYSVIFGGFHQIAAKMDSHRTVEKIVEDTRHARTVRLYDHYDPDHPGSEVREGNYLELCFPTGLGRNDVGYYLSSNRIVFIDDLNDQQPDHIVVSENIEPFSGSYVFFKNTGGYSIKFNHRDIGTEDGDQRVRIITDVQPRN